MNLSYLSNPLGEPFDVALFRQWMKLSFTEDDALIQSLMCSARKLIETYTGTILFAQIWDASLDLWPDDGVMSLRLRPFTRVVEATVATNSAPQSIAASLAFDISRNALIILPSAPKPFTPSGGIRLRLLFGPETADGVDSILRHALFNLVTHFYFNRGDAAADLMPLTIRAELDQLRERRLA